MSGSRRAVVSSIVKKGGSQGAIATALKNTNEEAAKLVTLKSVTKKK